MGETHSVTNQPPPLADYDLFSTDPALAGAVAAEGAGWAANDLASFGKVLGAAFLIELTGLNGRAALKDYDIFSLMEFA